jgi:hypothetical protein
LLDYVPADLNFTTMAKSPVCILNIGLTPASPSAKLSSTCFKGAGSVCYDFHSVGIETAFAPFGGDRIEHRKSAKFLRLRAFIPHNTGAYYYGNHFVPRLLSKAVFLNIGE